MAECVEVMSDVAESQALESEFPEPRLPEHVDLNLKQFFKFKPESRLVQTLRVFGPVYVVQCVVQRHQTSALCYGPR